MAKVTKNVAATTVLIDPSRHIGAQLRAMRDKKGFTGQQAMDEYNKLVPESQRLAHKVSYYQKEKREDVGIRELALMMKAIGVVNILFDDL